MSRFTNGFGITSCSLAVLLFTHPAKPELPLSNTPFYEIRPAHIIPPTRTFAAIAAVALLGKLPTASAQTDLVTPTTIYSLPGDGSKGSESISALVEASDGNFYGTTFTGSTAPQGVIYRVSPAGVYTVVHSFGNRATGDAQIPTQALVQGSDGNLYGLSPNGGQSAVSGGNSGAIYKTTLNQVESILYSFGVGIPTYAERGLI